MHVQPPGDLPRLPDTLRQPPCSLPLSRKGTALPHAVVLPAATCALLSFLLTEEDTFMSSPHVRAHCLSTQSCLLLVCGYQGERERDCPHGQGRCSPASFRSP
jgi:hypothetical protein